MRWNHWGCETGIRTRASGQVTGVEHHQFGLGGADLVHQGQGIAIEFVGAADPRCGDGFACRRSVAEVVDVLHSGTGFATQARFTGTVLTDQHRIARLLRPEDPAIYPGTFATCVFNRDKALCHQHRDNPRSEQGIARPALGDCRPLECANVALTADNITALRAELDRIDDKLAVRPSLPPLLQHRLRGRRDQISHFPPT